ncbi:MAG: hypothetical protein RL758_104 [Pseudomonadota bacterium]|jgi:HK97 family phage prohead protease
MNIFKAFAPITKVDDEQRMVYGYASTDTKDSQGEIVKSDAIEAALPDYMKFANIREMHTMSAVGVAKSAEVNENGLYIGAKIVDDAAWAKVKEGVYKGFSIGGKALEKANGIITKLRLTEISVVDRPANPECVIDTWKAEALDDDVSLTNEGDKADVAKADEQPTEKSEQQAAPVAVDHFGEIKKYDRDAVDAMSGGGKAIWDAQRAIDAMNCVFGLMMSEVSEKEKEPEQIAILQRVLDGLKAFVIAELQEKMENGTPVAMGDGIDNLDVLKAGAMYSKATKAALSKVHGMIRDCDKMMKGMGYDADMDKADAAELLVGTVTADDDLKKAATDLGLTVIDKQPLADLAKAAFAELAKSKARVTELEAQPAPAKAATTTIEKSDDTKDSLASPAQVQGDPSDPLSMFKAVLARPLNMVGN